MRSDRNQTNMNTTTSDMLLYLQQLRAQVAEAEQHSAYVSDSEDDEAHEQRGLHTFPLKVVERSVSYTNGDTYTGSMLGDQRHGQGTRTTSTGDVYTGGWQYDRRHGQGTFKAASGVVYEGSWADDKASGSGRCSYPDGSVYEGDWEADERCGWGKLTAADGQSYEGEWQANQPHGQGQWVFADGLSSFRGTYRAGQRVEGQLVLVDAATKKPAHTYTGRFENDLRHDPAGVGVEEGLWVYRGSWREDKRWGKGHCRYTDGSVYEGEWLRDLRHGMGCLTLRDGTTYQGRWQDDKLHGTAKAKYASGEVYVGQWQKGLRHGQGKWSSASRAATKQTAAPVIDSGPSALPGDVGSTTPSIPHSSSSRAMKEARDTYVGSWVAGKREGHGVAEYADGGRYEGGWKGDKRHGQGLMLFADGVLFRGAWEEDEWLQSAAEPALCRMTGPGLKGAVAGQLTHFMIQARDELSNPRLNGGDTFKVLLVPSAAPSALLAAAAEPLATAPHPTGTQNTTPDTSCRRLTSHPIHSFTGTSTSNNGSSARDDASSSSSSADDDGSSSSSSGASVGEYQELAAAVVQAVAEGQVQDNGDGTYSCSYTHHVAGWHELHVTDGLGEHIADSPCKVQILPGAPSPRHSIVAGPGRKAATAGCRTDFTVSFRDAYGNPCSPADVAAGAAASCSKHSNCDSGFPGSGADASQNQECVIEARLIGSNTITAATVNVAALTGGSFSCSYLAPQTPGLYVLEVTAGDRHVGGSPFSIRVSAGTATAAVSQQTLSAAASARAQLNPSATSAATPLATAAGTSAAHAASGGANTSSSHGSHERTDLSGAAAEAASCGASAEPRTLDKLSWWGNVARQAYAAIDGSLQGFDDTDGSKTPDDSPLMSASEAEMVKANPALPVVERLEDLWLLSKLQQERRAKEQQQRRAGHQQAGKPLAPAAQQQQPQSPAVSSDVTSQTKAGAGPQSAPQQQQEQTAGTFPETSTAASMSAGFSSSTPGSGMETLSCCSAGGFAAAAAAASVPDSPTAAAALETTGRQKVALEAEQQPGDSSTATGQCAGHTAHGVAAASAMQSDDSAIDAAGSDGGGSSWAWLYELD